MIDRSLGGKAAVRPKAEKGNPLYVGAPMLKLVVRVLVEAEEQVIAGQKMFLRPKR